MEYVEPIREKKKINAMKKILRASGVRNEMLFVLGINSALRVSDLLGLKVSDIKDENGNIRDAVILKEKKTGKIKLFQLNESAKAIIKEYLKQTNPESEDSLFPSRKGRKAISRVQAWQILNDAGKEAGIERIGTHTLRKTFGYHVYQQTNNLGLVQKLLNQDRKSVV